MLIYQDAVDVVAGGMHTAVLTKTGEVSGNNSFKGTVHA